MAISSATLTGWVRLTMGLPRINNRDVLVNLDSAPNITGAAGTTQVAVW